jgi:hypothetical protein
MVESLLVAPRPVPAAQAIGKEYLQALEHFQERRGLIEAHVLEAGNGDGHSHNHLARANRELGLNIGAALALGDMNYLGTDIEWVTGLLRNYQFPSEALTSFLWTYHQTAVERLDERGQPIIDWLGQLLSGQATN